MTIQKSNFMTPASEVVKIVDGKEVVVSDMDESLRIQNEARNLLKGDQSGKLIPSSSTTTNNTTANNNIISKPPISTDLTSSITPSSTNNEIVIDNIIPAQSQVAQSQGGGEGDLIVVESSLNSNVKDSLLLDAAYT